jgi:5'-methylthioadenosine phosphorylase
LVGGIKMSNLGIIVGTGLFNSKIIPKNSEPGLLELLTSQNLPEYKGIPILNRHGSPEDLRLPHDIDHLANMQALAKSNVTHVIGICSVGSLREEIKPGILCVPDDYDDPHSGATIHVDYTDSSVHMVPELDEDIRELIKRYLPEECEKRIENCIYVQTLGPRFETKTQSRRLARDNHIVGMTMGSEATIAQEMNMKYAALCMVDNYANGIKGRLNTEEMQTQLETNLSVLENFIKTICENEHTD